MNNWGKSILITLIVTLYTTYFWKLFEHANIADMKNFMTIDYLILFKISLFVLPLYMIVFILNWKVLTYSDFSFIYAQIGTILIIFIFSGSWSNAIYLNPALAMLLSGLYLVSFFDIIRNNMRLMHIFSIWILILVLGLCVNFAMPILPE